MKFPLKRSLSTPLSKGFSTVPEDLDEDKEQDFSSVMTPERRAYIIQLLAKKISKLVHKRRQDVEKNGAFASLCVRDAFEGRLGNGLATNSSKSPFIFAIYSLQTSHKWMNLVILSSAFHTLLTFMEPSCFIGVCTESSMLNQDWYYTIGSYIFYLHYLVWIIHASDAAMKVFYQGVREYFNHDWQQLYFLAILLHFLDLCVFGRTYFTNPLRPVVSLSFSFPFLLFPETDHSHKEKD